tara:strand:+ start:9185 stop:9544 length:360 start_codon:yes stop_codon:yes gene_type:complete
MPTIEIRARELEVATLRAQSDAAMATALAAVATMVQDSITARAVEHARHVEKLDTHGSLITVLTAQLEARGALWSRSIDFLSGKSFLAGCAAGIIVSTAVFGPFVLASMAPLLTAMGAT